MPLRIITTELVEQILSDSLRSSRSLAIARRDAALHAHLRSRVPTMAMDSSSTPLDFIPQDRSVALTLKALQEALDTVDVALAAKLESKSEAFFATLSALDGLNQDILWSLTHVRAARARLSRFQHQTVFPPFGVVQVSQRITRFHQVIDLMKKVATVLDTESTVGDLVAAHEFTSATQVAHQATDLVTKDSQLSRILVCKKSVDRMAKTLVSACTLLRADLAACFTRALDTQHVPPVVAGLGHAARQLGVLDEVSADCKDRATRHCRTILQSGFGATRSAGKSSADAVIDHVRNLLPDQVLEALELVHQQTARGITTCFAFEEAVGLPQGTTARVLQTWVGSRCGNILGARADTIPNLLAPEFQRLNALALQMAADFEAPALRSAMDSLAKAYFSAFHAKQMEQLEAALVREPWQVANPIPRDFQEAADALKDEAERGEDSESGDNRLFLACRSFAVTPSILLLVRSLSLYLELVSAAPVLGSEAVHRVCQVFRRCNLRIHELILGAGAIQSSAAGLKAISARHLALSAECIGVLVCCIPCVRRKLSAALVPEHQVLLVEFDAVLSDAQAHRQQILDKIRTLMKSRVAARMDDLRNRGHATPAAQVGPYAKTLGKEFGVLWRALGVLPNEERVALVSEMVDVLREKYRQAIQECLLSEKERGARAESDILFLVEKIGGGVGKEVVGRLLEIVRDV